MAELTYLGGYPDPLKAQVQQLIAAGKLGEMLAKRYPESHQIQSDKALLAYTMELKNRYLKSSAPLSKVVFDGKINVIKDALGLHTYVSRVQGSKLKAKNEIRIAALFKEAPPPVPENDRGARAGPYQREGSQQEFLPALPAYGAGLSSTGV